MLSTVIWNNVDISKKGIPFLKRKEEACGVDCLPCHFHFGNRSSIWKETLTEDILSMPPHDCCCLFHQSTCINYSDCPQDCTVKTEIANVCMGSSQLYSGFSKIYLRHEKEDLVKELGWTLQCI